MGKKHKMRGYGMLIQCTYSTCACTLYTLLALYIEQCSQHDPSARSDAVGQDATRDCEETLQEEEQLLALRREGGEGVDSMGPGKDEGNKAAEAKEKISGLSAVRKAIKNGDMFSPDLFGEKFLVSSSHHTACMHYLALKAGCRGEDSLGNATVLVMCIFVHIHVHIHVYVYKKPGIFDIGVQ